jgi:LmbE family N-acetylglucosaminyl deacetylase
VGTLVVFHAHPDDECISTGGSIARAVAEGHRVVLVIATNGDFGEVPDDLADGETLVDRRRVEAQKSADVLGIERVEWLGYKDSGMTGWEQNSDLDSFLLADVEENWPAHRPCSRQRSTAMRSSV